MLLNRLRSKTETLGLLDPKRWNLTISDLLFFLPTLFMAVAFEIFSEDFGKKGILIQLPSSFGTIPNFQPRLFPMEIYLAWIAGITLFQIRHWPKKQFWTRLTLLTAGLLTFGILRALPDVRLNPLLVVRNCAFLWYLSLPLMIALYPISSLKWERFFQFLYFASFIYFLLCLLDPFLEHNPTRVFWFIDLGLMFAVAYGFTSQGIWPRLTLGSIGFLLALSYFGKVQRTTFVGLALTAALLLLSPLIYGKFPRPRWRRLVWVGLGFALCVGAYSALQAYQRGTTNVIDVGAETIQQAKPGRVIERNENGVEKFRYFLWHDAWNQFLSAPLLGIGFEKPVVFRAYAGNGEFLENTGSFEGLSQLNANRLSPPISGPHNSYLNALARIGVLGAGVALLHLACAWLFLTHCYFACFFILIWQMIYAFFNVSLEGPIRSFPLLVLIGAALKLTIESYQARHGEDLETGEPRRTGKKTTRNRRMGLVHVPYRLVGGEDRHVAVLRDSYRAIGIEPVAIPSRGDYSDLPISAARSLTSGSPGEWDAMMARENLDFLHLNNIHATLGPAFLRWIIHRQIPAIMTVHNHRFYCTNGLAMYGSEVCKACRPGPSFLRPIIRNCNGSLPKTIYHSAAMVEIRGDDLLRRAVTLFLAPSPYIAGELQAAGIPKSRIRTFPHPVDVDGVAAHPEISNADITFVGRLSQEKGVLALLEAARLLPRRQFFIVGEGPLENEVREAAAKMPWVRFLGKVSRDHALALMKASRVVCVPSLCHESFSLVAAEALSLGARLVVPDAISFQHFTAEPFNAVVANVLNPESLAYSIELALEQGRRDAQAAAAVRDRFCLDDFNGRLRSVVDEVIYSQAEDRHGTR